MHNRRAKYWNFSHYIQSTYQARRHGFKSGPAEVRASAEGTSVGEHERGGGSTRGGNPPSRMGGSGDLPR